MRSNPAANTWKSGRCLLWGKLALLLCVPAGAAEPLSLKPFLYHEGFEDRNPVQFLGGRGKYTINFQGVTEEKAFSGKRSYKLDISFQEPGSSCDFSIPLQDIPAAGTLRFGGMIRVEEALPKSRAVLALDFAYWPCKTDGYAGDRSFPWNVKSPDWVRISADIPDRAHALASKMFPRELWPAAADHVAPYVQRIKIKLFARDQGDQEAQRRVVVYLDDLRIEGETADRETFAKDAERRWDAVRQKTREKIAMWEQIAARARTGLSSLAGLSGEAEELRTALTQKLAEHDLSKMLAIQDAKKNGWMALNVYEKLEPFYHNLRDHYVANVRTLSRPEVTERIGSKKYVVYDVRTTTRPAEWILPDTILLPGRVADEITIRACPGEYEPASFVVKAFAPLRSLRVEAGDLSGPRGRIGAAAVDVKVVMCWYQDEPGFGRVLLPELLLNDENLVRVDHARKISLLKFNLPQGPKHLCADDPEWPKTVDRKTQTPVWVANDSEVLLPVDIPAGENKQFWVTVKVPDDAKPGEYAGNIGLSADGKPLGEVALRLAVLPIRLAAPYCQTSVFVHGGENTIEKRYRNELTNQVAHGITAPMHLFDDVAKAGDHLGQLERTLQIRKELGVPAGILIGNYHIVYGGLAGGKSHKGLTKIEITDERKKAFRENLQKHLAIMRSYGLKDVYFHLADERDAKELQAWLPVFDVVHEAGGKVITCLSIGNSFEMVGGITDVFFCENGISRREADKWHSKGSKIWPIWNPRGGLEDTDLNRRNHGLLIWKTRCDGVTEYLYSMESAWLEAASAKTGAAGDGVHSMVYRTTEGVIDTIQWEGYREGIDDLRYVTTLQQVIEKAKNSGDKVRVAVADEAQKYLDGVDAAYGDLEQIRSAMVKYILALSDAGGGG